MQVRACLEAVGLDHFLLHNVLAHEQLVDTRTVVALQLDHLTPLLVVDDGAIAAEVLFFFKKTLFLWSMLLVTFLKILTSFSIFVRSM